MTQSADAFLDTLAKARNSIRDGFTRILVSLLCAFDENAKKQNANLDRAEAQLKRLEEIADKMLPPFSTSKFTASGEWNTSDGAISSAYVDLSQSLSSALGEASKYKRLLETLLETVENIDVKALPAFVNPEFKLAFDLLQRRVTGIRNLLAEGTKGSEPNGSGSANAAERAG